MYRKHTVIRLPVVSRRTMTPSRVYCIDGMLRRPYSSTSRPPASRWWRLWEVQRTATFKLLWCRDRHVHSGDVRMPARRSSSIAAAAAVLVHVPQSRMHAWKVRHNRWRLFQCTGLTAGSIRCSQKCHIRPWSNFRSSTNHLFAAAAARWRTSSPGNQRWRPLPLPNCPETPVGCPSAAQGGRDRLDAMRHANRKGLTLCGSNAAAMQRYTWHA